VFKLALNFQSTLLSHVTACIRKHFFTLRVVECWNRLSRELVESPLLEILETWLDAILGNPL